MKSLKKIVSSFIPKGSAKEKLKLSAYNLMAGKGLSFAVDHQASAYICNYQGLQFRTKDALYAIAPDFNYYRHFHKISAGEVILDAGANSGYISILFSKLTGPLGQVFAFEPDSVNIERIHANIALNPTLPSNIVIQDLLLWNENKVVDFHEAGTVGSSAVCKPEGAKLVSKQAVTIDSWVRAQNLDRLDFIKMDIEGAEVEAMEGCVETMKRFNPDFAIASYHIVNNEPTCHKIEEFFEKHNYPYKTIRFKKSEIITFAGPSVK